MTPNQKRIKTLFESRAPVCVDHIVCKRDGAVELKHSYFHHSQTADEFAARVAQALRQADIPAVVTSRDDFANWPKTSYIVAIVAEVPHAM
jgi:predicted RNA-binding protein with PIN domain